MKAIELEFVESNDNGGAKYLATLTHGSTPDKLTLTGGDVDNMSDADTLAVGSVIITPSANYIAFDQDGVFVEKE